MVAEGIGVGGGLPCQQIIERAALGSMAGSAQRQRLAGDGGGGAGGSVGGDAGLDAVEGLLGSVPEGGRILR